MRWLRRLFCRHDWCRTYNVRRHMAAAFADAFFKTTFGLDKPGADYVCVKCGKERVR